MGYPAPRNLVPAQFHPVLTPILRTTLSLVEYYTSPCERDPSIHALKRALHQAIEELEARDTDPQAVAPSLH